MIYAYRRALPFVALVGLCAAVVLRVQLAGQAGAGSQLAGVWFAAALLVVALGTRDPDRAGRPRLAPVGYGVAGAVVLCVPAAVRHVLAGTGVLPMDGYLSWALIVAVVAVAEEALLRGSLFWALEEVLRAGGGGGGDECGVRAAARAGLRLGGGAVGSCGRGVAGGVAGGERVGGSAGDRAYGG